MVNQPGTPIPLPSGHLPCALKSEPYLIHHTDAVHIDRNLCDILWELVKTAHAGLFKFLPLSIPHLIDYYVIHSKTYFE